MLAVQSPHHAHRGIGRYSGHLVAALLARDDGHESLLYAHAGLPAGRIPTAPHAQVRWLGPDRLTVSQRVDRLARVNPDGLDALVVLSPLEHWSNYHPPARREGGPRLLAVVYDMIPFLFPTENTYDPVLMRHYRALEDLKRYDALLAISEATRRDCLWLLGLPPDRVTNIGGASDGQFFIPDPSATPSAHARSVLKGLGIHRPFVLNVGGFTERKNLWTLIDAFALLPEPLRRGHQLVLTFTVLESDRRRLHRHARTAGVGDALVVTGEVSDDALRVLYQRCAAFAFPSLYEGFGLTLLEAMHCGAVVVAGNNSSQVEVVGDAGLLVNASDAHDIAAKLARVLQDEPLARSLRARAVTQASKFSWSTTAERAAAVLERLPPHQPINALRPGAVGRRKARPRIALFSPFPPKKSGIADYAAKLCAALQPTYTIDLYHEPGYVPEPALADGDLACCDARLFARQAAARNYHAVVYQMGNSRYHNFMYEVMLAHPGLVTLHDFCLAGFYLSYGLRQGRERDLIGAELRRCYPDQAAAIAAVLHPAQTDWDTIGRACAARGWSLNRTILAKALRMVVHSPWCLEQVRAASAADARRVEVIPLGSRARTPPGARERAVIRAQFGLPGEALVVACFGFINLDKMSIEAVRAFQTVAQADPSALFVFAGQEADGGATRQEARALGLADRVRFLGRQPAADYADLLTATDIGINLRRPPTNGETSAALLDLLAAGVATVVTDVATFGDYPDTVVRKVRWDADATGQQELGRVLLELARDPRARQALGTRAWNHVRSHHDWSRVAERYVDAIERCHADAIRAAPEGHTTARIPTVHEKHPLFGPPAFTFRRPARPRIAFFSPLPPKKSGVSDYAALLLGELKQVYEIDLYHESGYVPELATAGDGLACCDARLFRRRAAVRDYQAVVYQMGNSPYHHFLYETMRRYPGVVTLHDFCLAGFHMMYGMRRGRERKQLREELLRWHPDQAAAIAELLETTPWDREAIAQECARRGWFLNRGVIASAQRVVVHSPWCLDQLQKAAPEHAARTVVIPHGVWPRSISAADRAAVRARFDIPPDALLIASFGFVHPDKMSPEALDAFAAVARSDPRALFVFAGEEADGGAVRGHAATLGLPDRIRFLGRQTMSDFTDLIAATDIGVNLRRPPTHGETSGALLYLLASGVATIVTDVATFSDYPDTTLWKVRWESEGLPGLEQALRTLAADGALRAALGRSARSYTREHHEWPRVAQRYVEVIEACRENPWYALPARRPTPTQVKS
jgi:glycosyltransferase involved in cell wall biosynthesis